MGNGAKGLPNSAMNGVFGCTCKSVQRWHYIFAPKVGMHAYPKSVLQENDSRLSSHQKIPELGKFVEKSFSGVASSTCAQIIKGRGHNEKKPKKLFKCIFKYIWRVFHAVHHRVNRIRKTIKLYDNHHL